MNIRTSFFLKLSDEDVETTQYLLKEATQANVCLISVELINLQWCLSEFIYNTGVMVTLT